MIFRVFAMLFAAALLTSANVAAAASDFIYDDGFDVDLAAAYFVSPQGLDSNPGTEAAPFLTIAAGIAAAAADPTKRTVVVANGTYDESIVLADGVSVFGQFQSGTWTRDRNDYTIIDGVASVGSHDRTVSATDMASAATFDSFVVFGPSNQNTAGNSYAIYVSGSSGGLRITHNVIFGGHGGPGGAGAAGMEGTDGADAVAYTTALDSFTATGSGQCSSSNNRPAAGGGALICPGSDDVSGGNGGGNNCTPMRSTQNSTAASPAVAGQPGAGGGMGGTTGTRGYDSALNNATCYLPVDGNGQTLPTAGASGANGGQGSNADGGAACSAAAGAIVAGDWLGGTAPDGTAGTPGGGGGGGGAGGGAACTTDSTCKDMLGGQGGGGGSGGCGGDGGIGGGAGGGAFDIFIVGTSAPIVSGNTLFLGSGGDGGAGGSGGVGGLPGIGSQGGQTGALFCTGAGGRGGDGGLGGQGSGGGGGCGGTSAGIYTSGIGTPNYCTNAGNVLIGGYAGAGGTGGNSLGSPGGNGQTGVLTGCSFN